MELKAAAQARFTTIQSQMIALSHRIHAHPELGFEEEHASTWLAEALSDAGFAVATRDQPGRCDHKRCGGG